MPELYVAFLYGTHDAMQDMFRLSTALLRYADGPSSSFPTVPLSPITPYADQEDELKVERATREDVTSWLRRLPGPHQRPGSLSVGLAVYWADFRGFAAFLG